MIYPVFDLHCDTITELMGHDLSSNKSLRQNDLNVDLVRGSAFPAYAQCFAFWSTTDMPLPKGIKAQDLFWREVSMMQDAIDKNSDLVAQARTADEVRKNQENGKISAIFTLEGPANIGFDPGKLEKLRNLGFCISTLGWNEQNVLAGSHITGGGLTKQGRAYVQEAQKHGIIVDVSHISDDAFWNIMEITTAPVIASHSNSRTVFEHTRNLSDEMFKAICQTGGVVGINQYALFVGSEPDMDAVCDHIIHFLEIDPDGTHVALGGDLDGCNEFSIGFRGLQDYPKLFDRLMERGLDEKTMMNLCWNNALGVMEKCCI